MTPDPYRQAYEKAIEDLTQISRNFEQLSTRKKLVENLVLALQPVFATTEQGAQAPSSHASLESLAHEQPAESLESAEPEEGYSFLDVPAPLPAETDGDPFQRRVKANFRFKGLTAQRSY